MKFTIAEDFDAPPAQVWARVVDFAAVEADARSRGAVLNRVGDWQSLSEGAAWRGSVPIRGKSKPIEAQVTKLAHEEGLSIESRIGGMACVYEVSLVPLSAAVTRINVTLDLAAKTLSARLLLQTLKLARKRVRARLTANVRRQGNAAEGDWRRLQTG